MRTVVFSHNYPPQRNPRAFRIKNLEQSGFFGTDYLIITETKSKKVLKKIQLKQYLFNRLKSNSIIKFFGNFIFPDFSVFYQFYYLLFYLVRHRKPDDRIYTVSNPFSSHLIGIVMKRFYKQEWHADIGDIYFSSQTNNWFIHRKFERNVLSYADRIVVNSDSIKEHFIQQYAILREKIQLLPNGTNLQVDRLFKTESPVIRFSYIGNTYSPVRPGIQEIKLLLHFFKTNSSRPMVLQLFGIQDEAVLKLIIDNPNYLKRCYCQSDQELETAYFNTDILVNFANINHPGLPSKLEEYVASKIPLINFYYSLDDSSLVYLKLKSNLYLNINSNDSNVSCGIKITQFIKLYNLIEL